MNTYKINGIDALVTRFNSDAQDWSGHSWFKSNDMVASFNCDKLTISQLIKVINNSFGFNVDYIDTRDNVLTISVTEDGSGDVSDDGLYLVDYMFSVELITLVNLDELVEF